MAVTPHVYVAGANREGGWESGPGGEIMAHRGAAFVRALSRLGLIDEYRLVILPATGRSPPRGNTGP